LRALDTDPEITRIVGIDIAEPSFTAKNLEFYKMDIRSPDLVDVIKGCDTVVHLAAVSEDPNEIQDVNVGGTRSVVDAISRAGVRKLIFASSHSVYGAHADNAYPLTESAPVRPSPENVYARSKAEAETIVSYFAHEHPDAVVTTLRIAWTAGPNLPTSHARAVDHKVRFVIAGYDVPMQTVHEDDAAGAIAHTIRNDLPGTFNVCADEAVQAPEEILGQKKVVIPLEKATRIFDKLSAAGVGPSGAQLPLLMYPQVMTNEALSKAGFSPKYTARQTLEAAAEARRQWMNVGTFHVKRRSAVLVGALGAVAVATLLRGRAKRSRD